MIRVTASYSLDPTWSKNIALASSCMLKLFSIIGCILVYNLFSQHFISLWPSEPQIWEVCLLLSVNLFEVHWRAKIIVKNIQWLSWKEDLFFVILSHFLILSQFTQGNLEVLEPFCHKDLGRECNRKGWYLSLWIL